MKHSESIVKLAAALVAAQAEMRPIIKDSSNPDVHSTYASLDAIVEDVRPILAKYGLAVLQGTTTPESDEKNQVVGFTVESMLVHTSGEWITNGVLMPVVGRMLKGGGRAPVDAQAAGSAVSYGRRYGISALLSLVTGEDDDGRKASQQPKRSGGASSGATAGGATSATATNPSATAHAGPLTRESELTFGKSKGTKIKDLKADYLTWAIMPGRTFGPFTAAWQDVFAEELEYRRSDDGLSGGVSFPG
jgi:hypothetical protein